MVLTPRKKWNENPKNLKFFYARIVFSRNQAPKTPEIIFLDFGVYIRNAFIFFLQGKIYFDQSQLE